MVAFFIHQNRKQPSLALSLTSVVREVLDCLRSTGIVFSFFEGSSKLCTYVDFMIGSFLIHPNGQVQQVDKGEGECLNGVLGLEKKGRIGRAHACFGHARFGCILMICVYPGCQGPLLAPSPQNFHFLGTLGLSQAQSGSSIFNCLLSSLPPQRRGATTASAESQSFGQYPHLDMANSASVDVVQEATPKNSQMLS